MKTDESGAIKLTFLGAAGTVTGSKYLLEASGRRILVDCGIFQGRKEIRERNWQRLPFPPSSLDAVILTHAHLDHSGYIPVLVEQGFKGPVISTHATRDLCEILLPDSGYLMEKDADYANRKGFSRHKPALPIYTEAQAAASLESFRPIDFDEEFDLGDGLSVKLTLSGHILGSAFVQLTWGGRRIVFSGDLGRPNSATMRKPEALSQADYLVVESTYGNRHHEKTNPYDTLAEVITRTAARGGSVIIPSFAVGRSQSLLYHIAELKKQGRIPDLPVFLDSPMAINASDIFCGHLGEHRLTAKQCNSTFQQASYTRSVEASKALDEGPMPRIIVSASGMASGGRILHHLKRFAPESKNTILITGFQAEGTRGAQIADGAKEVKIHGRMVPICAEVAHLKTLSAHADQDEIMGWLGHFENPPKMTFVTHGEPMASAALADRIRDDLSWGCDVPAHGDQVELT